MEVTDRLTICVKELQDICEHLLAEQVRQTWVIKTLCKQASINQAEFDQLCEQADIWRERERLKQRGPEL
jgi:hypothetical protein